MAHVKEEPEDVKRTKTRAELVGRIHQADDDALMDAKMASRMR